MTVISILIILEVKQISVRDVDAFFVMVVNQLIIQYVD